MVGMNPLSVAELMIKDIRPELEKEIPKIPTFVWRAILLTGFAFGFIAGVIVGWLLL